MDLQQDMMRQRARQDNLAAIDDQMLLAFVNINQVRKSEAEKSLVDWVKTYCVPMLLDDNPPPKGEIILRQMERAINERNNFMCCCPRGFGKTTYALCTALYALATGKQKHLLIISASERQARGLLSELWRCIQDCDSDFANDYPEVCKPFALTNGSYRRRQLYRNKATNIAKNAENIILARLVDDDGKELPTSQSTVTVRGCGSSVRGLRPRPSLLILDDCQTSENAENPEQIDKLYTYIKKDLMSLGKGRLSILQTATPIQPDDLVSKIKSDKSWITTVYKAVDSFPENETLWRDYFRLYDEETVEQKDHTQSQNYYREHREEMDKGAEIINPNRFNPDDGYISGLQALMHIRHTIGAKNFDAEYQMNPSREAYQINITPQLVAQRINQHKRLEIPPGFVFVSCAIDINASYAITALVMAWRVDTTSVIPWHRVYRCNIDSKLTDIEYNQALYAKLEQVLCDISNLGIPINACAIDCGGKNWDTVLLFAKNSGGRFGFPICGFAGRSAANFNPNTRSRLRNAIGKTVLCGNAESHINGGDGYKYVFFDADFYKEQAQRAFLSPAGAAGSTSLYYTIDTHEHTDFAIQMCNERLLYKSNHAGRDYYNWRTKEPHDFLDCASMCRAAAESQGMSAATVTNKGLTPIRRKPKIRIT